jgi:hypothetical protein
MRSNNRQLQKEKIQLQRKNTQLQRENMRLKTANTQLQNDKTQLQSENTQLQSDKTQLQGVNVQLQGENTQLQNDKSQLQGENTQLQNEKIQLQDKNTQLQNDEVQLQSENVKLQNENTQLQKDIAQLQKDIAQLRNENQQLQKDVVQLKNTAAAFRNVISVGAGVESGLYGQTTPTNAASFVVGPSLFFEIQPFRYVATGFRIFTTWGMSSLFILGGCATLRAYTPEFWRITLFAQANVGAVWFLRTNGTQSYLDSPTTFGGGTSYLSILAGAGGGLRIRLVKGWSIEVWGEYDYPLGPTYGLRAIYSFRSKEK